MKIAVLPGDGIGKEIVAEAVKVLRALDERFDFEFADGRRRRIRQPWPPVARGDAAAGAGR